MSKDLTFEEIDAIISEQFKDQINLAETDLKTKHWFSTQNYALNWCISGKFKKGIPRGRISFFEGLSGTGKSLLLATLLKNEILDYAIIFLTEGGGISQEFLEFLNIDISKVRIQNVDTIDSYEISDNGKIVALNDQKIQQQLNANKQNVYEGLSSRLKRLLNTIISNKIDKKILIIVDSLANLSSSKIKSGSTDMGNKAHLLKEMFSNIDVQLYESQVGLVFSNHIYTNIGEMFGDDFKSSGGTGPIFASDIGVRLKKISVNNIDKEKKKESYGLKSTQSEIYEAIRAKVVKSRFGTYGRQVDFLLDLRYGINEFSGLFEILKEHNILTGSKKYEIPGIDEKIFKKDFITKMIEIKRKGKEKLNELFELWEKQIDENIENYRKEIMIKDGVMDKIENENSNEAEK